MLKDWKKRWDARPQGRWWLIGGAAAVVLGLALAWVLFVPAADWLAHHDVGSAKPALLQTARDAARGRLLTLAAGLFAIGALVYTARNYSLSREGQVTDRYTKAVGQLGDKKVDVRIGGIYALERIARDSPKRDHPTVMEVLTAFVREHSPIQLAAGPAPDDAPPGAWERVPPRAADIQAALTVVGRRVPKRDVRPIDLRGASLRDADLYDARLGAAFLGDTDLTGADLRKADLTRANLTRANLTRANLTGANLTGANLTGANFEDAVLSSGDQPLAGWQRDPRSGRVKRKADPGAAH
jgi:Pentapeptide repeats (8 copies)